MVPRPPGCPRPPERSAGPDVGRAVHELDVARSRGPRRLDDAVGPGLHLVEAVAVPVHADGLRVGVEVHGNRVRPCRGPG